MVFPLRRFLLPALAAAIVVAVPSAQSEKLDYPAIAAIRDEGLNHSQAMDTIWWLTDRYGPRLTGSPQFDEAADFAVKRMTEWGLSNVHKEPWDFGTSWSLESFAAQMVEPRVQPIIGFPKTWSVGTEGPVTADVVRVSIDNEADMQKYKGQLKGKIVLTQPVRAVRMLEGPFIVRMDEALTKEAEMTPIPGERSGRGRGRGGFNPQFQQQLAQFFKDEGVVAVFERGSDSDTANMGSDLSVNQQHTDGGTIFPGTVNRNGAPSGVPQVTIAVEHYNRMVRLLEHDVPVKVQLDVRTKFSIPAPRARTSSARFRAATSRTRSWSCWARISTRGIVRDRRDRQRDGIDRDDRSDAHHQGRRPRAPAHDPGGAVGR